MRAWITYSIASAGILCCVAVMNGAEQPRTIAYTARPIPAELRPDDSQVTIVDSRMTDGDGPLLSLPRKPPKFPDSLRDASRTATAIALAQPINITGRLTDEAKYIKSTIDLQIVEVLKRGHGLKPGAAIKTDQEGGTITIDRAQVTLKPEHLELYKLGQSYLIFLDHDGTRLTVSASYVLENGMLRSLNRLPMPKGFEDPLDRRPSAEVSKLIRSFVK